MTAAHAVIAALLAANFAVAGVPLAVRLRRKWATGWPRPLRRRFWPLTAERTVPPHLFEAAASPKTVAGTSPGLDAAAARARAFLRRRLRTGEYGLSCVGDDGHPRFSDNKGHVFVASFMTEALSGKLGEIDRALVLARILSEEIDGQWGFSPPGPFHGPDTMHYHVDADDTACVIRTLRRLGVNRPPDVLLRYRRAGGLFVTFDTPGDVALTTDCSPANNRAAHPEVNANVFLALRGTHLEELADYAPLARAQGRDGGWPSYFYPSALYGTLAALDALAGREAYAAATARARGFVADRQRADGSWGAAGDPYETALGVAALAGDAEHARAVARGVEHLLRTMESDGSWRSRACVWEFHAGPDDIWRAFDTHGAYVTARCLIALRRAAGELTAFS